MNRSIALTVLFIAASFIQAKCQLSITQKKMDSYEQREKEASPSEKKVLSDLRKQIAEKHWTFTVGYTSVADSSLDRLVSTKLTAQELEEFKNRINTPVDSQVAFILDTLKLLYPCSAGLDSYDARQDNIVPPVRYQQCGDCWAYSAIGALEISFNRVNNVQPASFYDLSEKQALDCFHSGKCDGGFQDRVFIYLKGHPQKLMTEAQYPDDGFLRTCPGTSSPPASTVELETWGSIGITPTVQQIKEAICMHGPVSCCMLATDTFKRYRAGIFNERLSDAPGHLDRDHINHAVIIIGWDDDKGAWLVRNSWRTPNWGMGGYAWVKYGYNNIGTFVSWVQAKRSQPLAVSFANKALFKIH